MSSIAQIGPVFAPTPSPSTRRTPAEASRLFFGEWLGSRVMEQGGYALRLRFVYRSPRGCSYSIEAAPLLTTSEAFTGQVFLRHCTCPDHQKRRGAAAPHSIERVCKHMQLVGELVASWRGRQLECRAWLSTVRAVEVVGPVPARPSQAQRQAAGWSVGGWEPATGWESAAASRAATAHIKAPRTYGGELHFGKAG